jgi:hypothetical protein
MPDTTASVAGTINAVAAADDGDEDGYKDANAHTFRM